MIRFYPQRTRWITAGFILSWFAVAVAIPPASAQVPEPAPADDPARGRDTGFFLSAGWVWDRLDLNYDSRVTQPEAILVSDAWGRGLSFGVGYGFGPRFRTEMILSGDDHDARPVGTKGHFLAAHFVGYVPLWVRGWIRPHLVGGFDACVTALEPTTIPNREYLVVGGDLGAGARFLLSRHWSVQGDYLHSVLDIDHENLDQPGDEKLRGVGGTGWSDQLRASLSYDF